MDTRNKIFAVVGTVAILATSGIVGAMLFTQKDATTAVNTPATTSQTTTGSSSTGSSSTNSTMTTTPSTSTSTTTSSYKDGTYTATISYAVPHGDQNSLKATVVISSGKISSVTTSSSYADRESGMYISSFESSVNSSASGQSIGSYSPSRIGGASLTTFAFSEAITDIAAQAKG